jgi:hypothetical protein
VAAKQRVKLMWDYTAFPLWYLGPNPGNYVGPMERHVSESLAMALQAWSDEWTTVMWGTNGPDAKDWKPPPAARQAVWVRRGRQLLAQVRCELGPDFEVGFFDEETAEVEWPD